MSIGPLRLLVHRKFSFDHYLKFTSLVPFSCIRRGILWEKLTPFFLPKEYRELKNEKLRTVKGQTIIPYLNWTFCGLFWEKSQEKLLFSCFSLKAHQIQTIEAL